MRLAFLYSLILFCLHAPAKEVALTFDDVPFGSTPHFETNQRTNELIRKLKKLNLPQALIFANPCRLDDSVSSVKQIKRYKESGHIIGNHTCSHPKFDDVGFAVFSADAAKADQLLSGLFSQQKFFRFPFLNEGSDVGARDQMRDWLKTNGYRNGMVSADNEDQFFSSKINQAKKAGKKINYKKVKALFIEHIVSALECDDDLAVKILGRSPKHVMLLHERDATVMFLEDLVSEIKKRSWKIIEVSEAYEDPMYFEAPQNTFAGYGIVSQLFFEKTGQKKVCYDFPEVRRKLDQILGL